MSYARKVAILIFLIADLDGDWAYYEMAAVVEADYIPDGNGNFELVVKVSGTNTVVCDNVAIEDVVCMLSGAFAPCVLRPSTDDTWILINGDCYVFAEGLQGEEPKEKAGYVIWKQFLEQCDESAFETFKIR